MGKKKKRVYRRKKIKRELSRRVHISIVRRQREPEGIVLPNDLVEASDRILKTRGSSVQRYLELQLIGFLNSKTKLGLDDTLNFGKYQGEGVKNVCNTDLSYMHWLVIEQRSAKFKDDVRSYVSRLADREEAYEITFLDQD